MYASPHLNLSAHRHASPHETDISHSLTRSTLLSCPPPQPPVAVVWRLCADPCSQPRSYGRRPAFPSPGGGSGGWRQDRADRTHASGGRGSCGGASSVIRHPFLASIRCADCCVLVCCSTDDHGIACGWQQCQCRGHVRLLCPAPSSSLWETGHGQASRSSRRSARPARHRA